MEAICFLSLYMFKMSLFWSHTQLRIKLAVELQIKVVLLGAWRHCFLLLRMFIAVMGDLGIVSHLQDFRILFSLMCWNFLKIYLSQGLLCGILLICFSEGLLDSLNLHFFQPRGFSYCLFENFLLLFSLSLLDSFVGRWTSISHLFSLITLTFILLFILWNFLNLIFNFFHCFYF